MGDRGQVFMVEGGVYLYTHGGASRLVEDVRRALSKEWRWDDDEYLARIIFDEMMPPEDRGRECGYGIGTDQHGDVWLVVHVDVGTQQVSIWERGTEISKQTFKEFIGG